MPSSGRVECVAIGDGDAHGFDRLAVVGMDWIVVDGCRCCGEADAGDVARVECATTSEAWNHAGGCAPVLLSLGGRPAPMSSKGVGVPRPTVAFVASRKVRPGSRIVAVRCVQVGAGVNPGKAGLVVELGAGPVLHGDDG